MNDDNDAEADLYDEFGNYIGPELESSSSSSSSSSSPSDDDAASSASSVSAASPPNQELQQHSTTDTPTTAIILHEDKIHYPTATQTYGPNVTTAILDEDAMELETPIVQPHIQKTIALERDHQRPDVSQSHKPSKPTSAASDRDDCEMIISRDYLLEALFSGSNALKRGIAVVGDYHCGKTTLLDGLWERTNLDENALGPRASLDSHAGGGPRLTDTLLQEQERQMSLKSSPITLALPDSRGKSYLMTFCDCPGHVQFHDETVAALRISDGAMLVVDAVEGLRLHTELILRQIVSEGLKFCLCVNKVDRLILELRLSPADAFYKLRNVIDEVEQCLRGLDVAGRYGELSPRRGNVCFGSGRHGWCVTVQEMAVLYADVYEDLGMTSEGFAARLWGDWYFETSKRRFSQRGSKRTFVEFVLEPIYKLYAQCLGEKEKDLEKVLRGVGVLLNGEELRSSVRPLIRTVMKRFFYGCGGGGGCGVVDMLVKSLPSPAKAAKAKILRCSTTPLQTPASRSMLSLDPTGPLILHVTKLYSSSDGQSFSAFGRIYSGTIRTQQKVKVLGESYSPEDDEDMTIATVTGVSLPRGRGRLEVDCAKAGNWVLVDGVDGAISKTATIVGVQDETTQIFTPLKFPQAGYRSIVKLAVEPLNPAELPKMVEGLRRISKSYPMAETRVEESGEHVLFGTGELYLDCMMHDLRHAFSDIEVKVADPVVAFRETVVETSCVKCFAETPNKRNKLTVIAEPLDDGLAEKLEAGKIDLNWEPRKISRYFQSQHNWDLLSSRSIWALGSSPSHGPNLFLDDTLPSEIDKSLLQTTKSSIIQGFQWAAREGPLCEEPLRSTKLKLLDATLASKAIHRGGGQIIPASRRTVHSAILTATPRLMEPIYTLQILCPADILSAIRPLLTKRRGHIVQSKPIPGSPLSSTKAFLPVIDSFGFETDLRTFTQGQAMVFSVFDHWAIVPGDPMDDSIVLHPLEPSPVQSLAREFLVKTRRRKGLSEDVSVSKFLEEGVRRRLMERMEE